MKNKPAVFILSCLLSFGAHAAVRYPVNRMVAIVNDQPITEKEIRPIVAQAQPTADPAEVNKQAIDLLVLQKLQLQIAARANITVDPEDVKKEVDRVLSARHYSLSQLKHQLHQENMDFDAFQEELKKNLLIRQLQKKVLAGRVRVSDDEIDSAIKQFQQFNSTYRVKDILIPLSETPTVQEVKVAKKLANRWRETLLTQQDAWQKVTKDKNAKLVDLSKRPLKAFPELFGHELVSMHVGEVSQPVRAQNGFHLLELTEKNPPQQDISVDQARNIIFGRKFNIQLQNWLQEIKDSAYVKYL